MDPPPKIFVNIRIVGPKVNMLIGSIFIDGPKKETEWFVDEKVIEQLANKCKDGEA